MDLQLVADAATTQSIFDIYRDWPFLGIIAALGAGIYFMFKYYTAEQKDSRDAYLKSNEVLWEKHKSERDELRKQVESRDQRAETMMQKLITTLEQDRK